MVYAQGDMLIAKCVENDYFSPSSDKSLEMELVLS